MKHLLVSFFFFLIYYNATEAQTYANIPGPENVLVVWNSSSSVSDSVKNYYRDARGIPESNIVGIYLPDTNITINNETHPVIIAEGGNIIRDSLYHEWGAWFVTQHAWKYFYQYMAAPIKEHIANNNLDDIRYIVLCKGVPFKIQAGGDSGAVICNLAVDGLLCMLNTNNYDILLDSIYNKYRRYAVPNYNWWNYRNQMQITNPYYNADPNLNLNNRFSPGVFTRSWNGHTIKLDYLVSHLDGTNYNIVKGIIDLSTEAIHADGYDWFIDADPVPCRGGSTFATDAYWTKSKLNSLGFTNDTINYNEDTVLYNDKPVISYSSNGVHTTLGPYIAPLCSNSVFPPNYIQSLLNLNYAPGAIFNTAESFNAHLLSSISRRPGAEMGQVVEFFLKGGTIGVGHAYEPFADGMVFNRVMFPTYQVGYSFIDAAYLGMPYLAWQNVVIGDPLCTIAWSKQTLPDSTVFEEANLITGELDIAGNAAIITNGTTLRFKHNGFITGEGYLIAQDREYTLESVDWNKSVFKSKYDNHPMIIWAPYPGEEAVGEYKIYRKWESTGFELIGTVTNEEFAFVDNELEIIVPEGEMPKNAQYYVVAVFLNEDDSGPSNQVEYYVDKAGKISAAPEKIFTFNLMQNYPNPFNPVTKINYSIAKPCLVTLKVYDILGKEISTLVNDFKTAGSYEVSFNASQYSSGMYLYKLTAGSYTKVQKMILLR